MITRSTRFTTAQRLCAAFWCAVVCGWAGQAQAGLPDGVFCPTPPPSSASSVDAFLQMAALIQDEWRVRAAPVALVSRSGLNLGAIGHRYSHAGFLRQAPRTGASGTAETAAVRQLYFDCETAQPRVFDEGLAGFVRGVATDALPRFSAVWWPAEEAAVLALGVEDDELALAMLATTYQAQAHVWSLRTQNCNQWLAEVLAAAFGGARQRASAQQWLRAQGYSGSVVQLPWVGWLVAAAVLPHMGLQHHPEEDLQALRLEVALPASVEAFVRRRWPQAQRVEWCLRGREVVVRRGWEPLDAVCTPRPGDEVRHLNP